MNLNGKWLIRVGDQASKACRQRNLRSPTQNLGSQVVIAVESFDFMTLGCIGDDRARAARCGYHLSGEFA